MSAISGATVGVALGIDAAIGVASLLLFSLLRICRPTNSYYDPRTYYGPSRSKRASSGSTAAVHGMLAAASGLEETRGDSGSTMPPPAAPTASSSCSSSHYSTSSSSSDPRDAAAATTGNAAAAAAAARRTPSLLLPSPSPLAPPGESGMPLPGSPLPPVLPKALLTWVVPLLRLPEQHVIAAVGLDVAMLLRFIRFALKLLLVLMVWCIGVVLPVNYTGTNLHSLRQAQLLVDNATNAAAAYLAAPAAAPAAAAAAPPPGQGFFGSLFPIIPSINGSQLYRPSGSNSSSSSAWSPAVGPGAGAGAPKVQLGPGQDTGSLAQQIEAGRVGVSDLDVLSMANIPAGSSLLWVHLTSVYVVTAITLKLLWSATSDALRLYLHHLSSSSMNLDSASHTALLTDIPGLPRGTLIDKVLHTPLFWLLPARVRRRLKATWFQFFSPGGGRKAAAALLAAGSRKRKARTDTAAAAAAAADEGGSSSRSSASLEHFQAEQQQQQQQQNGGFGESSAGAVVDPVQQAVAIHIAPKGAASAASDEPSGCQLLDSSTAAAGYDQSAADSQQQRQRFGAIGKEGLRQRSSAAAGGAAAAAAASSSSRAYRRQGAEQAPLTLSASQQRQQQQQQGQQQDQEQLLLLSDTALGDALRAQQGLEMSAGVGGVGVFSDEWRRAARALEAGMSLEDFVLREFQQVYGPHNVVAVHIVSYSPRIAKLVQQYSATRIALEDLLDHYNQQLHAAAAAAGRKRKRSRLAALLAAPFAALARCCRGGQQQQKQQAGLQRRAPLKPVKVRTLPLPKPPKNGASRAAAEEDGAAAAVPGPLNHHGGASRRSTAGSTASHGSSALAPAGAVAAAPLGAAAGSDTGHDLASVSVSVSSSSSNHLQEQQQQQDQLSPDSEQQQQQQQPVDPEQQLLQPQVTHMLSHRISVDWSIPPSEASTALMSKTLPAAPGTSVAAAAAGIASAAGGGPRSLDRLQSHYIDFADDSSVASSMRGGSVQSGSAHGTTTAAGAGPAAAAAGMSRLAPDSPAAAAVSMQQQQLADVGASGPAAAAAAAGCGSVGSSSLQLRGRLQRVTSGDLEQQHGGGSSSVVGVAGAAEDAGSADGDLLPVVACKQSAGSSSIRQSNHKHSSKPWHSSEGISAGTAGSDKCSSARGCMPHRAARGDACDVLLVRLQRLQQQLADAHSEAQQDPVPAAFVTFRTRTALTAAVSSHHVAEAGVWKLTAAPPPDSLIWGKLGLRYWEVGLRRGLVYSVLVLLAFFYVVPVAVVQGLLQLERLQSLPVIGTLVSLPVVHSLLVGVLPGLALRIFVLLLPVVLYALNRRAGPVGAAQLDGWVATHFFALQVIIVFFASFITGSLFNQVNVLFTQGLAPVLDRLGTGAPQTANFFILYIIFTAFIGRSWALLRPWGLLMSGIRALAARNKGRSGRRRALLIGTYRMFGPSVPEHSMILLLGLVLCVIAPLVLCAAFVFFCMAIVVESYNWVWVFRRPYEGGGRLWKQLFRHVFIALYIFQLIMAALLIVKRFVWVALLVPLILITALVQHIGSKLLQRSWDVLSVRAAHELDLQDTQEALQALSFWRTLAGQTETLAGQTETLAGQTETLAGQTEALAGQTEALAGQTKALAGQQQPGHGASEEQRQPGKQGHQQGAACSRQGESVALMAPPGAPKGCVDGRVSAADIHTAEDVCRSQVGLWAQLYRPPAEQLLEVAGQLQAQLGARVVAMQGRLAVHNEAAAAEVEPKRIARDAVGQV